ncbi:3D domain-containing protein [Bacillus licheniformis]|nr:3D domain-containing protein [Bacillus licheniformis]
MIAVDPSVIPLGSKVHVEGYGYAVAADTGSAIKGRKSMYSFRISLQLTAGETKELKSRC